MNKLFPFAFDEYNLLDHPFYKAWNEGILAKEQLAVYGRQYGRFVELIAHGWQKIGEASIAEEEELHYLLWQNFYESLQASTADKEIKEVTDLVNSVKQSYQSYGGAIGALYAFEAQQPETSLSKLQGLEKCYASWKVDKTYFEVHAGDLEEPALLEQKYHVLSADEKLQAQEACEQTCIQLWNALTGIMNHAALL